MSPESLLGLLAKIKCKNVPWLGVTQALCQLNIVAFL